MTDDGFDNTWQMRDVQEYNGQCQPYISQCHNGDNDAAYFGDALDASEDDQ